MLSIQTVKKVLWKQVFMRPHGKYNFITNGGKLTHFMSRISFDTPWKRQKTSDFLMFSGGIKRDQWHEMSKETLRSSR